MGALSAYGVGGTHRHTPEIDPEPVEGRGDGRSACASRPSSRRCRAASSPRARRRRRPHAAEVVEAYAKAYADEPFVHLLPEGVWPSTAATLGANTVHLQVTVDADAGRMVAVAAIDNLTKGTAGGAVQCMNLALGLPEGLGLPTTGVAP